jgi:hypothetical protein
MSRLSVDRRRFLKLVGATALTYPFLRGVPSYAAGAAGGPYLILLFTGCGVVRFDWGAQGPAPSGTTGSAVTSPLVFRSTLSAFTKAGPSGNADLTNQIVVLDGLSNRAAGGGTHESGMASLWTGTTITNNGGNATGPSIDQAIAPLLQSQLGVSTPYPSIALMAQSSADFPERQVDTRMLYDATGNWVDPYTSPPTALAALFPHAAMSASSSSGPDKAALVRQKVAAQVNADIKTILGKMCSEDRQQLQNFQDLYNSVLAQLQSAEMATAACSVPTSSSQGATGTADPFPTYVSAMNTILAMALACNLTRVASLQLSHALSPVTHTWLGSSQTQTHHVYSHMGPAWIGALGTDLYKEPSDVTSQYPQQLVDIDAWYAQQVANLAYTMSQLKSGSGSLLDQSVICWGSEIDMGAAHNHDDTPFVLIGGAAGRLKTNQLVRFPLTLGNQAQNNAAGFRFHNDLLLTLAKIMGVSLPGGTFGTASYCTGPIAEILT